MFTNWPILVVSPSSIMPLSFPVGRNVYRHNVCTSVVVRFTWFPTGECQRFSGVMPKPHTFFLPIRTTNPVVSWMRRKNILFKKQTMTSSVLLCNNSPSAIDQSNYHLQCATFLMDWPGRPFLYTNRPDKHKLDRGWDLASCQVSLNSVQRFERISWKFLSQWETGAAILFFRSARKTQT